MLLGNHYVNRDQDRRPIAKCHSRGYEINVEAAQLYCFTPSLPVGELACQTIPTSMFFGSCPPHFLTFTVHL